MKLTPRQLTAHLQQSLLPVYLLSGDEPLQMMEAADAIRKTASQQGFSERQIMHVEASFDWSDLQGEAGSLSLFAQRKILDLRIPNGKPGQAGSKALVAYSNHFSPDNLLLIQSAKLEKNARSSAWVKALEKVGAHLQIWQPTPAETLKLVAERLQAAGFKAEREAVRLLTEQVEGNLLAAAQEIEKLRLLHPPGPLTTRDVITAVSNSARYDPFELVDAALVRDTKRVVRILHGLRTEGLHESQILWALSRDIRMLSDYSERQANGHDPDTALRGIWPKRRTLLVKAARHHSAPAWLALLQQCVQVERQIKGLDAGSAWDHLLRLTLGLAGTKILARIPHQKTISR